MLFATVDAGQTLLNWRKVFSCSFLKQNVTQDLWHETDVEIGESYMRIYENIFPFLDF